MGHYELVVGWSDTTREFIVMDSYLGPNQSVSFDDMDKYWRQFNRTYIVVYRPEQQPRRSPRSSAQRWTMRRCIAMRWRAPRRN